MKTGFHKTVCHKDVQPDAIEPQMMKTDKESEGSVLDFGADRGARAQRSGLILPNMLPFEDWRQIGKQIFVIANSCAWWIGDWLTYGENTFGDRYEQAITDTSLDYQTLRNYTWIAKKFTMSRRRDNLSFGHHVEVAALIEAEQDEWLTRAERFSWSRNELRRRVRVFRLYGCQQSPLADETETRVLKIDVPIQHLDRWQKAAKQMNCSVTEWIITALDAASATESTPEASN